MKTYEIKCNESLARLIRTEANGSLIIHPFTRNNGDGVVIGYEKVPDQASREDALLQFINRPRNIQFVGKEIYAGEITPNTTKMRQETYAERIKDAENIIEVARFLSSQL